MTFSEPVVSSSTGVYALFQLPAGNECVAIGAGGGAGIGYGTGSVGSVGWLSSDGQSWVRIARGYEVAVQPILVAAVPGMRVLGGEKSAGGQNPKVPVYTTELLPAAPNPFNPHTQVRYSLAQAGRAKLTIYDLRGKVVRRLLDAESGAGPHVADWNGRDDRGRSLASGIYFVRFVADGVMSTQRVTLVR